MAESEETDNLKELPLRPMPPLNINLLYANVVTVGLTLTDVHLTASVNGRPALILAIPLPTAKTLSLALQDAISRYEAKTNTKVLDLPKLNELLK